MMSKLLLYRTSGSFSLGSERREAGPSTDASTCAFGAASLAMDKVQKMRRGNPLMVINLPPMPLLPVL
jgi:hypothetical protein